MKRFKFSVDIFVFAVSLLLSSVFLGFSGGGFIFRLKEVGFSLTTSVSSAIYSTTTLVTDSIGAVAELSNLKKKYDQLVVQLNNYELLQRSNADLKKENEELRSLLSFSKNIGTKNIAAEIIAFDYDTLYNGIVVNKGARHGIKRNMTVIAFQDGNIGLVGKIVEVGLFTSMILPLYDAQFFVAAKTELKQYRGLVSGQGSLVTKHEMSHLALLMKYVKKSAQSEIRVGDKVLSSGFDHDSIFPKNIPIGFISKIKDYTYETSLELEIEPVLDFSRLNYVFILDKQEEVRE